MRTVVTGGVGFLGSAVAEPALGDEPTWAWAFQEINAGSVGG
jgi:hypothetical protein